MLDKTSAYKAFARALFLKRIYKHVDYALYVGKNNKEYFLQYGLKERQLIFAPHAIDNSRFANADEIYRNEAKEWKR